MTAAMQAKLPSALQDRIVTPVGGKSVAVDVRVLAATHQDLTASVRDGRFREDLYYRLGVVRLYLPPLRERLADIVPLAEHFLSLASAKRLTAAAAARLVAHSWAGNVRELRNAMERMAALVRTPLIDAADLSFLTTGISTPQENWLAGTLSEALARLEAAMIARALAANGGNRTKAARKLGIHWQLLHVKLSAQESL